MIILFGRHLPKYEGGRNLLILSVSVILITILLLLLTMVYFYRVYQKRSGKEIIARERLFDLLVKDTQNAFALYSLDLPEPIYITSNAVKLLGGNTLFLTEREGEILFTSIPVQTSEETEKEWEAKNNLALAELNQTIKGWDRATPYVSPYISMIIKGETHYIVAKLYPVSGSRREFIAIAEDVTQEQVRAEALKNALALADSANKAKTDFMSKMSHDIRTPLNAILNMALFMKRDMTNLKKQETYLNIISDSSEHLLSLVNEILDMSKIESGKLVLAQEPFDMNECVTQVCDIIRPLCEEKQQTLQVIHEELKNRKLLGDTLRLRQILLNLLNNAVKFTERNGAIQFEIEELPTLREEIAAFRFIVTDNGIGIDAESLGHIFEPFERASNTKMRVIEGSGLGLSISKSYIEAMGGNIRVESEPGKGTCFIAEVYFNKDNTTLQKTEIQDSGSKISFEGKPCLVVEDSEINQQIAGILLRDWGFVPTFVGNGKEAVDKIIETKCGFALIFMDVMMPVMDGYEACRTIRGLKLAGCKTIPIIAMTANVMPEDVEKARQAGMDAHVGKPIRPNELLNVIIRMLQKESI